MIKPINGHLLIEPVKHESFMASQKETYEEVGVVIDFEEPLMTEKGIYMNVSYLLKRGCRVFFDSYLAAKYPKGDDGYYWLVNYQDIRAIEPEELDAETVPK